MRILLSSLALLLATAAAPDPVPHGRLPDIAKPLAYRIDLTVLPEKAEFSGQTEIDIETKAVTSTLYLHGRDLKMAGVLAFAGGKMIPARYTQVDPLGVVRLDFATPLPAGKATLKFFYEAPFGDGTAGLFRAKVGDSWYAWSQFESIDARAAFPGFDEPGFKTPFTIRMLTHSGQTAVSNAPETGTTEIKVDPESAMAKHARATGEPVPATMTAHVFAPTRPLPTYLVSFAAGPFAVAKGAVPPTAQRKAPLPLGVVASAEQGHKLDYALQESPRIVELLEKYFDQPFPFPKLDQVAAPVMNGAMENAGADLYADNIILLDKGATTAQRRSFGMVVAHELSHQWFGDLVTPTWWDDLWLNESFANWMGFRIGNAWRPELDIGTGAVEEALSAMNTDSLKAGRAIHQPILTSGEIDAAFDPVTYGKGGQVVAMIASYMGDDKFRDGVRLHLKRHAYGNATSEDFFASLAEAAHDQRVVAAMKSFVDQQGVPVVTVTRQGGKLTVAQARYTLLGSKLTPETWTIPLCLRVGAERQCTLLDKPSATLAAGAGAIMPNAGGTGYYRFDMPDAEWAALFATSATMPAGEALAATDSLWASFRAGHAAPARLVDAARRMAANPNPSVAVDGGARLAGLRSRGMIAATAMPAYRRTMASIYAPMLKTLGLDPAAGAYAADDPKRQKLRADLAGLVAGEAHDTAVRATLDKAATAYLAGDDKALDQAFRTAALGVHVEDGGVAAARPLFEKMVTAKDSLFRANARSALGGSGNPDIAKWLLSQMDDKRLRQADRTRLLTDMMGEAGTRDLAYGWLTGHFDAFAKAIGTFDFAGLMAMPNRFCSVEKARAIEAALRPKVKAADSGGLPLDRTIEQVTSCGTLYEARARDLAAAFGS